MGDYLAALTATIVFTGLFSFFLVYMDIDSVKQNWDKRRCELPVMITAALYKPKEVSQSSTEFATDNFNYCSRKIANEVIRLGMAPYYVIAGQQVSAQNSMGGPMNNIRGAIAKTRNEFSKYLNYQYKKYESIFVGITKSYLHFRFAIGRIQALVYSLIYMLIAIFKTIMNTMKLTIFALKIFLGILLALMIVLFFILNPFMVIIVVVIAIVAAVGLAAADGAEEAMCCDPDAHVYMADGSTKRLKEIRIGDVLKSSDRVTVNIVKGVLTADGKKTTLRRINGIYMSQSHRVLYKNKWILAKDHPEASIVNDRTLDTLICLNTSLHEVPLVGIKGTVYVGDWEEVSTLQGQKKWIDWVHLKLNGIYLAINKYPTAVPLVSRNTCVFLENYGTIPIEKIKIGDRILSKDGYTDVKAIYDGSIRISKSAKVSPEWMSDGVWSSLPKDKGNWFLCRGIPDTMNKLDEYDELNEVPGIFLITGDGMFIVKQNNVNVLVRDFTEVGLDQIDQSYEMIDFFMNKK